MKTPDAAPVCSCGEVYPCDACSGGTRKPDAATALQRAHGAVAGWLSYVPTDEFPRALAALDAFVAEWEKLLGDAATVIERMANGASRAECSPELDRVIAALLDPAFDVAFAPDAALSEVGDGLREAMGAGELVGSLPADGEHLPDLGGADQFHLAERYRLTASSARRTVPLDTVKRKEAMSTDRLASIVADLRQGWYLRAGISKVPSGYFCLEYGFPTTTGARNVVAAIHPDDLDGIRDLYPEAFKHNENADRCPMCGGLRPGDVSHTRCM